MSVEIDSDKLLEQALREGIREGVKSKLSSSYGNPFDKLMERALAEHGDSLRELLSESLASCIGDPEFRSQIAAATRATLAKTLVQRFGGELEKQVNALKSDPTTRARITVAIEEIVKQNAAG